MATWPWPGVRWDITYGEPMPCVEQPHRDYCEWCTDRSHWAPDRRSDPEYHTATPRPLHRSFASGIQVLAVEGPRTVRWRDFAGVERVAHDVQTLRVTRVRHA